MCVIQQKKEEKIIITGRFFIIKSFIKTPHFNTCAKTEPHSRFSCLLLMTETPCSVHNIHLNIVLCRFLCALLFHLFMQHYIYAAPHINGIFI